MPPDLGDDPTDDRPPAGIVGGSRSTRARQGGVRPLVVVGFDGSEGAARAIAATTTLMAGAEALVVCVYRSVLAAAGAALLGAPAEMVRGGARALDAQRRAEAEQTAERGAALAAAGGCASQALALAATGAVWAAIDHLAEQHQAAALVVGARGLSGLSRLVLGSVSSGLVHHATRPVLVVPDPHPARRPDGDTTDHAPGRTLAGVLDRQAPRA
jgi:nucleotide-binding universal stress UspA family protein